MSPWRGVQVFLWISVVLVLFLFTESANDTWNNSSFRDPCFVPQKKLNVTVGSNLTLSCSPPSTWSNCTWKYPSQLLILKQIEHVLQITVSEKSQGEYKCHCMKNEVECDIEVYILDFESPPTKKLVGSNSTFAKIISGVTFILIVLVLGVHIFNTIRCYTHVTEPAPQVRAAAPQVRVAAPQVRVALPQEILYFEM
ncbi:semaphorin-4F-like [Erpetoichthys calabaricus]|uniref:semaphorin-4F-like n=1 Tax=Erpetoichthys calabaricus TaxID=27687 RepID=UPI0022346972|nr:semaphorin-4F-like [Erpetoichthys calabaricus]